MNPGDCINIPVGVKHWHGATPDLWFSHLAIEVPGKDCSNEWLERRGRILQTKIEMEKMSCTKNY